MCVTHKVQVEHANQGTGGARKVQGNTQGTGWGACKRAIYGGGHGWGRCGEARGGRFVGNLCELAHTSPLT